MCGIAGQVLFNDDQVKSEALQKMTDVIFHRGPDGEGQWINNDQNVGLGHRRLSILDLSSRGAQPMHFAGKYTITFNGEIYNYLELKDYLEKKGYVFSSGTDTEVVLAAYDCWGVECLSRFDGMFALALWDSEQGTLFCARDRFGEKPFYYNYHKSKHFVFGSEQKCLFAYGIEPSINQRMLFHYLAYDVVENCHYKSETFYNGIYSLEAGHYLLVGRDGTLEKKKYWDIDLLNKSEMTFEQACDRFYELLQLSVERRLRSDVPVGSSLSGGLDSSSIVLMIYQLNQGKGRQQKTFSARFEGAFDEGYFMEKVVNRDGIEPCYTWPSADILIEEFDKLYYHQEEPFGSASILAQWEVMKLARENNVTVLLDGQGADEVIAGYPKYFRAFFSEMYLGERTAFNSQLASYQNLYGKPYEGINMRFKLGLFIPNVMRALGVARRTFSSPQYFEGLSKEFVDGFKGEQAPFQTFNKLNETLKYDTLTYGLEKLLRFADRNSMAFSREIRLPFLSHELVEFVFSLPADFKIRNGWTKAVLRHAMKDVLPNEIAWRKDKLGFQPPQNKWLQQESMREFIAHHDQILKREGILQKGHNIDIWKTIMAGKLFENSKTLVGQ